MIFHWIDKMGFKDMSDLEWIFLGNISNCWGYSFTILCHLGPVGDKLKKPQGTL